MGINLSCSCPWCQSLGIPLQRALKTRSGWQEEAVGVKVSSPEVDALPSRILMSENLALGPHRSNHVLQRKLKQAAGGVSVMRARLLPALNPEELLLLLQS